MLRHRLSIFNGERTMRERLRSASTQAISFVRNDVLQVGSEAISRRSEDWVALHASAILPTDIEKRSGDLPERAHAHGVHQLGKDVAVFDDGALEPLQGLRRGLGIASLKFRQTFQL